MNIIREYQPRNRRVNQQKERSKVKAVKRPLPIKAIIYLYIAYMSMIAIGGIIGNGQAAVVDNPKVSYSPQPHRTYTISRVVDTKTLTSGIEHAVVIPTTYRVQNSVLSAMSLTEKEETGVIEEALTVVETTEPVVEEYIEPELIPYHQDDFNGDSSVMCMSGLTAEQIEGMLENYPGLSGLGEAIYNVEQENGVNAFYTLAVASLESGYGKSNLAVNKNNLFGLMGCSFDSKEECVAYFGRLMINYQDKHNITMTPNGINPRYCTTDSWASQITQLMNQWAHKANDFY